MSAKLRNFLLIFDWYDVILRNINVKDSLMKLRYTFLTVMMLLISVSGMAQYKWNQQYQDYVDKYKDIAIREMNSYGIPASITLAQGLLESGAGKSELAVKGNNHFGIKCHDWTGATIYHDDDATGECFRAYDSALGSYEDHSRFLASKQRYRSLFSLSKTDYKGWAHGLKKAGYATSPTYAHRLIEIIELYQLHQYDSETKVSHVHHHNNKQETQQPVLVQQQAAGHQIRICNQCYYVIAHRGDTFRSIGEETGFSYKKLASFNERDKNDVLSEGDIVYLTKKKTKADKSYKNKPHVVKAGDSMYSIAQRYGMKVKSLYKLNGFTPDHQLKVGECLRLY